MSLAVEVGMSQGLYAPHPFFGVDLQAPLDQRYQSLFALQNSLKTLQFEYLGVVLDVSIPVVVVQIAILQKQPLELPIGPMSHPRRKLTTQFVNHVYMIEIVVHMK